MNGKLKSIFRVVLVVVLVGSYFMAKHLVQPQQLVDQRKSFKTNLIRKQHDVEKAPDPPAEVLRRVKYPSPAGDLVAYLTPNASGGSKLPAIVWIVGGFSSGIDETAWADAPATNDQSAGAFRKAGIAMMYPSFRGGNDNPGVHEAFLGEVDDLLAAIEFLSRQPGVDPHRIYLGGHSTGGTMAMLAAECSDQFRAVFAFGPARDVGSYGQRNLPFDVNNQRERFVRSPGFWLKNIKDPTFVFEGTEKPSNILALANMSRENKNSLIHFYPVGGATHFSILQPITRLIADKIVHDTGPDCAISFSESELKQAYDSSSK